MCFPCMRGAQQVCGTMARMLVNVDGCYDRGITFLPSEANSNMSDSWGFYPIRHALSFFFAIFLDANLT